MAEFSRLVITEKGQQLISKIFSGTTGVKFTKISTSSKAYDEAELSKLEALEEIRQTNPVAGIERTESAAVKVVTAFTNAELTEGYYLRAMGLFAEDPDEGEILYGVTAELSGNCYMPPYNGVTLSALDVEMVTAVGNAENISLEVDPAAAVTVEQLNAVRSRVEALEGSMANIETLIIPVYVKSESLAPLVSGEKLSVAFGKLAKAVSELISHLADNVRHITASERSKWNGKTTTTFSRALNGGTKIGTITVDGTATDIFCERNTDTVYSNATASSAGLMSAADKAKLDSGTASKGSWVGKDDNRDYPVAFSLDNQFNYSSANTFRYNPALRALSVGAYNTSNGNHSVAMGEGNVANNEYAVALGRLTTASGGSSFASGNSSTAKGTFSTAMGLDTIAGSWQFACGCYNAEVSGSGTRFIIGDGSGISAAYRRNAFRVGAAVYANSSYQTSGADYAEYFEWLDGNPEDEDRRGLFVTIDGEKINPANADDYILGVISAVPSVVGDVQSEEWHGRYLRDIFGEKIIETVEAEEMTDEKGAVIPAHVIRRPMLNPDYDPEQEYVSREDRKEWAAVGMMGKLVVVDDGTCRVNGYCMPKNGVATASETGYRVISRLDDTHVKVLLK